jgi:peptidoglycan hydrolase-like protein with peptidoglycan-binding domain
MSAIGAGAAVGQTGGTTLITQGSQGDQVSAVQSALGVSQTGTYDSATARAVRAFQGENGLVVDGIVGPETSAALGLGGAAPAGDGSDGGSEASGGASPELEAIAQCESGGDPSAVSSDGQFRGKYQFSRETWAGVGGTGDPAAAPESVQDELAAQLYTQSGTSPWPNCG